ncbi:hypothetical protein F511_42894 [Dorcoceras hygrometricum]|uniref:Peptidase C1A papain C-terminal domain-containing protein n=1 Tax=Dorcoceras hygrometricum TaxID=472368 RepID=A0A2Z7B0R2_9LAMI|nr:hypothetical protein F511_42894 [Dorcoceras hygrometricum]
MANEEFRATYLIPRKDQETRKLRERPPPAKSKGLMVAPSSIDWREKGAVGPVRDQGLCAFGSWAFAAVAAVESAYQIKTGNLTLQELLDCDRQDEGCLGGSTLQCCK